MVRLGPANVPSEPSEFIKWSAEIVLGFFDKVFGESLSQRFLRFGLFNWIFLTRISDMAVVPYQQDQAPRLDFGAPT